MVQPVVFISYRHVDAFFVRGLQVELQNRLPPGRVIRDLQEFRGGDDLRVVISDALERATVVLAVVGPTWADVDAETRRGRIQEGDDWVRFELALALAWNKVVIPVLINDTPMPDGDQLPTDLAPLALRIAHRVRDSDWSSDVAGLIEQISPGAAPQEPNPLPHVIDSGPIAGGDINITGTNVAGRDLTIGTNVPPPGRRRRGRR
jgi:hypothetical protein